MAQPPLIWSTAPAPAFVVEWSEEDGEWVGLCPLFPSLSWLAVTPAAALRGIRDTVWVELGHTF